MRNKESLDHFANYLMDYSDTSDKWEIRISGTQVSFNGKRIFASKGAAKACLNRQIQYALMHFDYISEFIQKKPEDVQESMIFLGESDDFKFGHNQPNQKEDAKDIIAEMEESGLLEIRIVE